MKLFIEWKYKTPTGTEIGFKSEEITPEKALLLAEDIVKTGRVRQLTLYDQYDTTWTIKELKKYVTKVEAVPHDITVFFDGGFDGNTKKSGLGCAIYFEQGGKQYRIRKNALVEELNTNGEAEYAALHLAVKELEFLGVQHMPVIFIGDSQGVINQLNDEWPCYDAELLLWIDRIEGDVEKLEINPEFQLISRKKNGEADHLATQALMGVEIYSKSEI
ncbi:reverse transcriptase-like protein [Ornithinibacillus bavariensis]|uniref:reverse transcriptase-like protein n=1 Tax=Ornithinibacillus bavariensis TaxID=545502 RepID=UPI000EC86C3A|nr:hypothetical protein [Ornithinibacillus sp.]